MSGKLSQLLKLLWIPAGVTTAPEAALEEINEINNQANYWNSGDINIEEKFVVSSPPVLFAIEEQHIFRPFFETVFATPRRNELVDALQLQIARNMDSAIPNVDFAHMMAIASIYRIHIKVYRFAENTVNPYYNILEGWMAPASGDYSNGTVETVRLLLHDGQYMHF
jgi:hypothetical protein